MADKFTLTLEYDRDKILVDAQTIIDQGGDIYAARRFLDIMYPAWGCDLKTVCKVELMFRDGDDQFRPLFERKLAELEVSSMILKNVDQVLAAIEIETELPEAMG